MRAFEHFYLPELLSHFEKKYKEDEVTSIEMQAPEGEISVGVELLSTQWEDCFTGMKRKNVSR